MRKEFQAMLVMVVCSIIGVIFAAMVGLLYEQGYITGLLIGTITIENLQFLIFFLWLISGAVAGSLKN